MFFYFFRTYYRFLFLAAIIPAAYLLVKVYKADKLEKENPRFLAKLILAGIISTFPAIILERLGDALLAPVAENNSLLYRIIEFFIVVAFAEEGSKYFFLKKKTWENNEFNCKFDGVVYAVFTSLGFAICENISYVLQYGLGTAFTRALTAIPGHACFAVFMGLFYSLAKESGIRKEKTKSILFRILAVVCPALLHGTYDFLATLETEAGSFIFFAFIAVLFTVSIKLVNILSKKDRYFTSQNYWKEYEIIN